MHSSLCRGRISHLETSHECFIPNLLNRTLDRARFLKPNASQRRTSPTIALPRDHSPGPAPTGGINAKLTAVNAIYNVQMNTHQIGALSAGSTRGAHTKKRRLHNYLLFLS